MESTLEFGPAADVSVRADAPTILLVCEHASNHIPAHLNGLSVSPEVIKSHVAWDPGALGVAQAMAGKLPSVLVAGTISRLVYDCNRPPGAASAIPEKSEIYEIPGNKDLNETERKKRVDGVFLPFSQAVSQQIDRHSDTLQAMVTVHSFTPVYHGANRQVEIGVLHGKDERLATAFMMSKPEDTRFEVRLNEPYAATDGVTHTLDTHGAARGVLNVMLEIRNDLIASPTQQMALGAYLADWVNAALNQSLERAP